MEPELLVVSLTNRPNMPSCAQMLNIWWHLAVTPLPQLELCTSLQNSERSKTACVRKLEHGTGRSWFHQSNWVFWFPIIQLNISNKRAPNLSVLPQGQLRSSLLTKLWNLWFKSWTVPFRELMSASASVTTKKRSNDGQFFFTEIHTLTVLMFQLEAFWSSLGVVFR